MSDFKATIEIPDNRIADLLYCGMAGGIGYWACIIDYVKPKKVWQHEGWKDVSRYIHYPMSEGGAVILRDAEENPDDDTADTWRLDREALRQGIQLMSTHPKYKHHFANFINENEDAETGDVFIQLCVLGDVVFS